MNYTLIVGDAATYGEGSENHADFQSIDFIKTFSTFEEAQAQGEHAIASDGHDTYLIMQNLYGMVSFNQGASK
jgi:hypothetical protein